MMGGSSQMQKRNMEKFTSKLRNIQETKFPIVKAAFKGKDAQIYIVVPQELDLQPAKGIG